MVSIQGSEHKLDVENDSNASYKDQYNSIYLKEYDCHSCSKKFGSIRALRIHKNKSHLNPREKVKINYQCDICDFSTLEFGKLKRHNDDVHLGLKPFTVCVPKNAT